MTSSCTVDEVLGFLEQKIIDWISGLDHHPFEITASQFRDFAIEDSKMNSIHNRVNALSNVKRAIECRIDELLYGVCLHIKSERENWNFPKKIQVLGDLGILAPPILTKINRKRNQLEHQYVEPSRDDVEDALDVANLFIVYTDRFWIRGPILEMRRGPKNLIAINRKKGIIAIKEGESVRELKISDEDGWLKVAKILTSSWTR